MRYVKIIYCKLKNSAIQSKAYKQITNSVLQSNQTTIYLNLSKIEILKYLILNNFTQLKRSSIEYLIIKRNLARCPIIRKQICHTLYSCFSWSSCAAFFFTLNRFLPKKINGHNVILKELLASAHARLLQKPVSDIKRIDDWALDVAVLVTVKH